MCLVAQSCPTLCSLMDCRPPGSSVHGDSPGKNTGEDVPELGIEPYIYIFLGGSDTEESACNARDLGSIPESGRSPGEGNGNPFQYPCLENPHGQRSLVDYSQWDRKESDTTEQLSTAQHSLTSFKT